MVTDIEGNTYQIVKIGKQVWMAENLKVTRYRNGDPIPHGARRDAWFNLTTGAYCSYGNEPTNAATYGYLYNWYAVSNWRGLAPKGWHVPTDDEWRTLVDYLGGADVAGGKLKETLGWKNPNTDADNESGFSGLPGGFRGNSGLFSDAGERAFFWSSTKYHDTEFAWARNLYYLDSKINNNLTYMQHGLSVRCVSD